MPEGQKDLPQAEKRAMDADKRYARGRALWTSGFVALLAGLFASIFAVVTMGILRLALGIPMPVELFGDFSLKHIDVATFIRLLGIFNFSKTKPLGLALLGMLLLGAVLGLVYAAIVRLRLPVSSYRPSRREWLTALGFAVVMTALGGILFRIELPQNFVLGLTYGWSIVASLLGLLLDFVVYGLALCLSYRALLPKVQQFGEATVAQSRRLLLTRAGVTALGVGGAGAAFALGSDYLSKYTSYDGQRTAVVNQHTPPITPNSEHYTVTQNPIDPGVNINFWRLELTGLLKNGGTYTYDELKRLPSTTRAITLECISNSIGDHLIGTAIWQGVSLKTLLERQGGSLPSASYIAMYSVDGYTTSLPLKEVLDVDPLLAWNMNGVALPTKHGYPLRMLIPGRYGEENPKWLTRIELTDHFVGGLYSDQGWYNGPLHTMSRIDRPQGMVALGQVIEVGGIAFAGPRGIEKVEVSADNGESWHQANMQPAISPDAWVLWTWDWTPAHPGSYSIQSRATDGTGTTQIATYHSVVPNGATGYPHVSVQVR